MTNELSKPEPPETPETEPVQRYVLTPSIDIFDTDEGLVLRADLPGVSADTIDLQVEDNKLTLFGRAKPEAPADARVLHQEYVSGDYYRSFILSDDIDHEHITARLTNGVLEVRLPRASKGEPRRIQVKSD